jgi:flagellar motor switch/type III secretory pathway protein FliN
VVLRVAGRSLATGELVDVDGDLAVRILSLSAAGGGG